MHDAPPRKSARLAKLKHIKTVCQRLLENSIILQRKMETYTRYLENVRGQTWSIDTHITEFPSIVQPAGQKDIGVTHMPALGPYEFPISRLDRDGITLSTHADLPSSALLTFSMPCPGLVVFSIRDKGRQPLFNVQCNIDEMLQRMENRQTVLQLGEWATLDAYKTLVLLDHTLCKS